MRIGKDGIRREIDPKRFAEFKEKGYAEIFAEEPPVVEEEAPVTKEVPATEENPLAKKSGKKE